MELVATSTAVCNAHKRSGGACTRPAGWGTAHVGQGRCKLHGGNSPIKHGRYSIIRRESLRDLAGHFETDPDPLNLLPDLAQCRALYTDFINRYDAWSEALLAWHDSYKARDLPKRFAAFREALASKDVSRVLAGIQDLERSLDHPNDGRPAQILDVTDAYRILSEATKIATRIEQNRAASAIARKDLFRILGEMGRSVEGVLLGLEKLIGAQKADEAVQKIRDQWSAIKLA